MSLDTNIEIWESIARDKYPELQPYQLQALSMRAASEWYTGIDNELTQLFDQYVMIKNLRGIGLNGKE